LLCVELEKMGCGGCNANNTTCCGGMETLVECQLFISSRRMYLPDLFVIYLVMAFTEKLAHSAANLISNNACCNEFLSARLKVLSYRKSSGKNNGCLITNQLHSKDQIENTDVMLRYTVEHTGCMILRL
jgi:hypothetical protein